MTGLRGGFGPSNAGAVQNMYHHAHGLDFRQSTKLTRISWKKLNPDETYESVEVAGSWSGFGTRHALRKTRDGGSWDIQLELPKGEHQLKFILNGKVWKCHPELQLSSDGRGNQNNLILVNPSTDSKETQIGNDLQVLPSKDNIEITTEMVAFLESKTKTNYEDKSSGYSQCVDALVEELDDALSALTRGKRHIAKIYKSCLKRIDRLEAAATSKTEDIKVQVDRLRSTLAEKESKAVQNIYDEMNKRTSALQGQVDNFAQRSSAIDSLMAEICTVLKDADGDTEKFYSQAVVLLDRMKELSECNQEWSFSEALADFDGVKLDLMPE